MEWQPIETAPKDGTEILTTVFMGIWDKMKWVYAIEKFSDGKWSKSVIGANPTHWMPLPPPPTGKK